MTHAEIATAMADYIDRTGFSPQYNEIDDRACGCFLHAYDVVVGTDGSEDDDDWMAIWKAISEVTGLPHYGYWMLMSRGLLHDQPSAVRAARACRFAAEELSRG